MYCIQSILRERNGFKSFRNLFKFTLLVSDRIRLCFQDHLPCPENFNTVSASWSAEANIHLQQAFSITLAWVWRPNDYELPTSQVFLLRMRSCDCLKVPSHSRPTYLPACTFHPLKQHRIFIQSFLYQVILKQWMNLSFFCLFFSAVSILSCFWTSLYKMVLTHWFHAANLLLGDSQSINIL